MEIWHSNIKKNYCYLLTDHEFLSLLFWEREREMMLAWWQKRMIFVVCSRTRHEWSWEEGKYLQCGRTIQYNCTYSNQNDDASASLGHDIEMFMGREYYFLQKFYIGG